MQIKLNIEEDIGESPQALQPKMSGFASQICWLVSYLIACFLICKLGISPPSSVVWKISDKMYKVFEQYVEYSRCARNGVNIISIKQQRLNYCENKNEI